MNRPLLSICIPTYNRAPYLRVCLEHIVRQFSNENVRDRVEIVVSDNCSPDDTEIIGREYERNYSNIRYFRNEENKGFDLNVVNVVEKARGVYCWYMGDDDIIRNGELESIVEFLNGHAVAVLTVGSKLIATPKEIESNDQKSKGQFHLFGDFNKFREQGNCVGIFSVLILNRDLLLKFIDVNDFVEGWLYYEVVLKMLPKANLQFAYYEHPVVYTRQGYEVAVNGGELFAFLNWKIVLNKLIEFGYEEEKIKQELDSLSKKINIILLRSKGHDLSYSPKHLLLICNEFKQYPLRVLLAAVIFFVPNPIVKVVRDLNKKIRKI